MLSLYKTDLKEEKSPFCLDHWDEYLIMIYQTQGDVLWDTEQLFFVFVLFELWNYAFILVLKEK